MDAISKNPKLLVRKEESQLCDQVYIYGVFFFFNTKIIWYLSSG